MPSFDLPEGFALDHFRNSAIARIGESAYSIYILDEAGTALAGTFTLSPTQITFPDDTDPALLSLMQAQISRIGQPPSWDGAALSLFNLAGSAVGVAVQDLTTAQVKALLLLILWDRKALDNELKVKPLRTWVKRRPAE